LLSLLFVVSFAVVHQISLDRSGKTLVVKSNSADPRLVDLSGVATTLNSIFTSADMGTLLGCMNGDANNQAKLFVVDACTGITTATRVTTRVQTCDQVKLHQRSSPPLERLWSHESFNEDSESSSEIESPTRSQTTTMTGDHYSDVIPLPEGVVAELSSDWSESEISSQHSYHHRKKHPREHRDDEDEDEDETETISGEAVDDDDGADDRDQFKVVPPNDALKDKLLGEKIFERSGEDEVAFENDEFDASEVDDEKILKQRLKNKYHRESSPHVLVTQKRSSPAVVSMDLNC